MCLQCCDKMILENMVTNIAMNGNNYLYNIYIYIIVYYKSLKLDSMKWIGWLINKTSTVQSFSYW